MHRVVHVAYLGEEFGGRSALEKPASLDQIKRAASDADNRVRERLDADKIVCVTFTSESSRNWSFSVGLRPYLDDVGIGAGTVAVICP